MPYSRDVTLITVLLLIGLPYGAEFAHEVLEDYNSVGEVMIEGSVMLLVFFGIAFLIREIRQRQRDMEQLHRQLKRTRADLHATRSDLEDINQKVQQASRQYGEVIQQQMSAWDFTPSEKDVALLLLKGLSFEEIASVRETREKTVRQQASTIYRKSGLNGRHELAAWFFEDFLQ